MSWKENFKNNAKLSGDINESVIISHCMTRGWDVFKNMSCTGPIDMIIYNREENILYKIDAKSSEKMAMSFYEKVKDKDICTCYFDDENKKVIIIKGGNLKDGYEKIEI